MPFVLKVVSAPPRPHIEEVNQLHCEGHNLKMYIDSLHDNIKYVWNSGIESDTIKVTGQGTYFVTAYNTKGCKLKSNEVKIDPRPKTNEWLSGCMEACLPRDFCLNLNPVNTYTLYRDGVFMNDIKKSSTALEIVESGDYHVKVMNPQGCEATSDVFSLTAKPNVLSIVGKVYYDVNENGVYDEGIDVLLENIPVTVSKDSTVLKSLSTDEAGKFQFDSLTFRDMQVAIDVKNSGYSLSGNVDALLQYSSCLEGKVVDFPLKKNCFSRVTKLSAYVCHGEKIKIGDALYNAFDKDTLVIPVNKNCDSIVTIEVLERPRPSLDLKIDNTCSEYNTGQVTIEKNNDFTLVYSLDNQPFSADTIMGGLAEGKHTLSVIDEYGCMEEFDFGIDVYTAPKVDLVTENSCIGFSEGLLNIIVLEGSKLAFKLDSNTMFTNALGFEKLNTGLHTLYVQDTVGCIYMQPFAIEEYSNPKLGFALAHTCKDKNSGFVKILAENGCKYKLDSIEDYSDVTFYDNLSYGSHMLFGINEYGCIDSATFDLKYIEQPSIGVSTLNACKDIATGSLIIKVDSTSNLKFRIGSEGTYSNSTNFYNLAFGNYTLYYQDTFGCQYSQPFFIDSMKLPIFDYTLIPSCHGQNNGQMLVNVSDELSLSLDRPVFGDTVVAFSNISPGYHHIYTRNKYGCIDSMGFEIIETDSPSSELATIAQCENSNLGSLYVKDQDTLLYSFDGSTYDTLTSKSNMAAGDYKLYIKSNDGCIYEQGFNIPLMKAPTLSLSTIASCIGMDEGAIHLSGRHEQCTVSIDSIAFSKVDSFVNLAAGKYKIFLKNELGCGYSFNTEIKENPLPIFQVSSASSCPNKNTGILSVYTNENNYVSINGADYKKEKTIEQLSEGTYTVAVKDSFNCITELQAEIKALPNLRASFPLLEQDCYTNTVTISPEIIYSNGVPNYIWSTGDRTSSLVLNKSGLYIVTISDMCEELANEWRTDIQIIDEEIVLYAPNVFYAKSANGNGCFKVIPNQASITTSYALSIYDRWGNKVFESHNQQDCWDGRFNGEPMVPGVYVYIADIEVSHCNEVKKIRKVGDVTLLY